jgi:hypothetical protein
MYFYFLLTPWVYVGISTKNIGLGLKKDGMDFLHERSANKLSNSTYDLRKPSRSIIADIRFPNLYQLVTNASPLLHRFWHTQSKFHSLTSSGPAFILQVTI